MDVICATKHAALLVVFISRLQTNFEGAHHYLLYKLVDAGLVLCWASYYLLNLWAINVLTVANNISIIE